MKDLSLHLLLLALWHAGEDVRLAQRLLAGSAQLVHHQALKVPVQVHAEVNRGR